MPDFLHLPNLRTLLAQDMGDHYKVEAEGGILPTSCPTCHNALYRHGSQRQTYFDTPMHAKRRFLRKAMARGGPGNIIQFPRPVSLTPS